MQFCLLSVKKKNPSQGDDIPRPKALRDLCENAGGVFPRRHSDALPPHTALTRLDFCGVGGPVAARRVVHPEWGVSAKGCAGPFGFLPRSPNLRCWWEMDSGPASHSSRSGAVRKGARVPAAACPELGLAHERLRLSSTYGHRQMAAGFRRQTSKHSKPVFPSSACNCAVA